MKSVDGVADSQGVGRQEGNLRKKQFAFGLIAGITLTGAAANAQLVTGIWLGWKVYGERGLICRSPSVYPAMQTIECR